MTADMASWDSSVLTSVLVGVFSLLTAILNIILAFISRTRMQEVFSELRAASREGKELMSTALRSIERAREGLQTLANRQNEVMERLMTRAIDSK